jgi:hypothetical protein
MSHTLLHSSAPRPSLITAGLLAALVGCLPAAPMERWRERPVDDEECWAPGVSTPALGAGPGLSSAQAPPPQGGDASQGLAPLVLPQDLPAPVYTRSAPVSVVDERGSPMQIIKGHHTLLELRQVRGGGAQVSCEVCEIPVTGWVQTSRLMPEDHTPEAWELEDDRLALALFVIGLRRGLIDDGGLGDQEPGLGERRALLKLLDRGFERQGDRAVAPPGGGDERPTIRLELGPEGWEIASADY